MRQISQITPKYVLLVLSIHTKKFRFTGCGNGGKQIGCNCYRVIHIVLVLAATAREMTEDKSRTTTWMNHTLRWSTYLCDKARLLNLVFIWLVFYPILKNISLIHHRPPSLWKETRQYLRNPRQSTDCFTLAFISADRKSAWAELTATTLLRDSWV